VKTRSLISVYPLVLVSAASALPEFLAVLIRNKGICIYVLLAVR